jgi:zinc transport system substrate-binding protein
MRLLVLLSLLSVAACGQQEPDNTRSDAALAALPRVATVNYPLAWAAEQLCGDTAEVYFPAPAGIDPAFWQPGSEELAAYQQSALIFLNGANYARWVAKVSLPTNRLRDTSRGFVDRLIEVDSGPLHSHGPEGDHSHGEQAFTVWLDLELLRQQVESMAVALAKELPIKNALLSWRRDETIAELGAMDEGLREVGEALAGAPLLYSHPVYQYLQRAYGFNGIALHWEPDQLPSEADLRELDQLLSGHPARLMLWEDEPLPGTRKQLEDRGIQVLVFRTLGNRPKRGDFSSEMAANIARLKRYLAQ